MIPLLAERRCRFPYLTAAVLLLLSVAGLSRRPSLAEELTRRSAGDGLALISIQNNSIWLKAFDGSPGTIRNPRDLSRLWLSEGGEVAVWGIQGPLYRKESPVCPSPAIVESIDGHQIWQLPGDLSAATMSVSSDGRRVAFYGTFKPPCTCDITPGNRSMWVTGLQYVDRATGVVNLVPNVSEGLSSISWAPDGNSFAYDSERHVFVYDVVTRSRRRVADGSTPAFSPDGQWLTYRSVTSQATMLDRKNGKTSIILGGKTILWGIHWSPDSHYIMVAENRTLAYDVLHGGLFDDRTRKMVFYRIEDGGVGVGRLVCRAGPWGLWLFLGGRLSYAPERRSSPSGH